MDVTAELEWLNRSHLNLCEEHASLGKLGSIAFKRGDKELANRFFDSATDRFERACIVYEWMAKLRSE